MVPRGLEGVEVDETAIALVDGEHGELSYRGEPIARLVTWPYSRVVWLVLHGMSSTGAELRGFEDALLHRGKLTTADARLVALASETRAHPMHVLQGVAPLLDTSGVEAFEALGFANDAAVGLVVAAKLPSVVATLLRLRTGQADPTPTAERDPILRFLHEIGSDAADHRLAEAFRVTQILQIEHGFSAGTFTARVIASTLAKAPNCIAGALGALHGPLHGGADQATLEMADEAGDPKLAAAFVDESLANGRKVMGMGHREYKTLDPRARFVKDLARELAKGTELERTFETLEAIEARFREVMMKRGKSLYANLEFYKGVVYRAAGLPADYFTASFAMARVFGYMAHFIESRVNNRIMRPSARYVGPPVDA